MWPEFLWLGNACGDEPSGCIKEVAERLYLLKQVRLRGFGWYA